MTRKSEKRLTMTAMGGRAASRDPREVSRYYHDVMKDAIAAVRAAEAQKDAREGRGK